MRIGEVARRAGVSDKTLRYYEEIGVVDAPPRSASGYRDYDQSVVERVRFVRAGQSVGLSLGELREVLALRNRGQTPCAHVTDLIKRRAAEIDEQITELERLRSELRRLARRAQRLDPKDCRPDKVCHVIEH